MKKGKQTEFEDDEEFQDFEEPQQPKENPFDPETHTPTEILFQCGRHNLPPMHAVRLLRGHYSDDTIFHLGEAIQDPDSDEMQAYADGLAAGEAEMSVALRQATIESKKDAYKSMNNEDRQRNINQVISKNFGIG